MGDFNKMLENIDNLHKQISDNIKEFETDVLLNALVAYKKSYVQLDTFAKKTGKIVEILEAEKQKRVN